MKHGLQINVSKKHKNDGIFTCRKITIREKLLRFLLGSPQRVTILVPGDTVDSVSITETEDGGEML